MPTRLPVLVTAALLAVVTSAPGRAESPLERGTYLMNAVAGCGNCHSPFTAEGPTRPELSGGPPIITPAFTAYPRNPTPPHAAGVHRLPAHPYAGSRHRNRDRDRRADHRRCPRGPTSGRQRDPATDAD